MMRHDDFIISGEIKLVPNFEIESYLLCPRCGDKYLHQIQVTTFERAEDDANVMLTQVTRDNVRQQQVGNDQSSNPSARRQGVAIRFYCECCSTHDTDDIIEMTLAQHKGMTLVGWRYTPRRPFEGDSTASTP